ncbi:NAD(P)H-dependent oxidoreductase [Dubosiella newyorkensis]|uniref:NAD(P)H-dependent oxidoreductase n=1 Tax=Dubosiella newyorkensis TaxID=1862672 RepID=UPI00258F4872|nr:NADPH-dependent FMN reductase [Dubosiella newyorkensis]
MKICIVVGSFRKDSLNVQLAQIIQESLEKRAIGSMIRNDLEIPMFNQDLEFPVPDSIQSWRDSFLEADGIWFVTPEYNGQIPGSLKNLLDWMSRPMSLGAAWTDTAMRNQCATVSGIGGRNGTKSVQKLLIELLNFGGMKMMDHDLAQIAMSSKTMETSQIEYTPDVESIVEKQVEAFLSFIKMEKNR